MPKFQKASTGNVKNSFNCSKLQKSQDGRWATEEHNTGGGQNTEPSEKIA